MLITLLVLICFIPALFTLKKCEPPENLKPQQAAFWLIAALVVSLAVGIYTFFQMRKMQKKNKPTANQLDGTIADEGVSFCDIAGSPHMHGNIVDIWGKRTVAIKQKGGKK